MPYACVRRVFVSQLRSQHSCVELDVVARLACDRATLTVPLSASVLRALVVGLLAIHEPPHAYAATSLTPTTKAKATI